METLPDARAIKIEHAHSSFSSKVYRNPGTMGLRRSKAPVSQLVNAEVNSGNSSTSNYTQQLRIRECHAGMKCDLKVTKHLPPSQAFPAERRVH